MLPKITKDEIVYDGAYLQTVKRHFRHGKKEGVWEFVKRKNTGNAVAIFALTPEKEVILERVFRLPFGEMVVELPAGLTDNPDETPEETVKRELLEETGYEVKQVEKLLEGPVSPGILTEEMTLYFGKNAKRTHNQNLGESEEIEVFTVPISELADFVEKNQGTMKIDVKILAALAILKNRGYV